MKSALDSKATDDRETEADGSVNDAWALVERSWGFPAFARDFPRDAQLTKLVMAFATGDYLAVRVGADALAEATPRDDVKRAALDLRARIRPDPASRILFALTAVLLAFLSLWWVTHSGPPNVHPAVNVAR